MPAFFDATTLSIRTLSIRTLSIRTFTVRALRIRTLSQGILKGEVSLYL